MMARCLCQGLVHKTVVRKGAMFFFFLHVNAVMQTQRKGFVTLQILMYLMNAAFRSRL